MQILTLSFGKCSMMGRSTEVKEISKFDCWFDDIPVSYAYTLDEATLEWKWRISCTNLLKD
jgi:hypothetical protein